MSYHPDDVARHTIRSHDPQLEPEFCRPEPDDNQKDRPMKDPTALAHLQTTNRHTVADRLDSLAHRLRQGAISDVTAAIWLRTLADQLEEVLS